MTASGVCCDFIDGTARQHYELVHLRSQSGGEARCALCFDCSGCKWWLASGSSKACEPDSFGEEVAQKSSNQTILVEVLSASVHDSETALEEPMMRLWVGVVDPQLMRRLKLGAGESRIRQMFGRLPELWFAGAFCCCFSQRGRRGRVSWCPKCGRWTPYGVEKWRRL